MFKHIFLLVSLLLSMGVSIKKKVGAHVTPSIFHFFGLCLDLPHAKRVFIIYLFIYLFIYYYYYFFLFIHFIFSIDVIWSLKRQERNESKLLFSAPDYYFRSPKSKFVI